jgi:hypothetical protein
MTTSISFNLYYVPFVCVSPSILSSLLLSWPFYLSILPSSSLPPYLFFTPIFPFLCPFHAFISFPLYFFCSYFHIQLWFPSPYPSNNRQYFSIPYLRMVEDSLHFLCTLAVTRWIFQIGTETIMYIFQLSLIRMSTFST